MTGLRNGTYFLLAAAVIALVLSVSLWFSGHREEGLFVGLWVPSILSLGSLIYSGRSVRQPWKR